MVNWRKFAIGKRDCDEIGHNFERVLRSATKVAKLRKTRDVERLRFCDAQRQKSRAEGGDEKRYVMK